jgi:hypothetical protein
MEAILLIALSDNLALDISSGFKTKDLEGSSMIGWLKILTLT